MTIRADTDTEHDEEEAVEEELDETEESEDEQSEDDADDSSDMIDAIVSRVSEATTSQIDARINSLMKTLRKDYGLAKQGSEKEETTSTPARDRGLDRVLRGAVRDAVADEFDSPKERKFALGLAKRMAEARGLAADEDEDEIAEDIVASVREVLHDAKEHYEASLRRDLEQRGLLEPDAAPQPSKKRGKQDVGKSPTELFKQGQQKAIDRFGLDKE